MASRSQANESLHDIRITGIKLFQEDKMVRARLLLVASLFLIVLVRETSSVCEVDAGPYGNDIYQGEASLSFFIYVLFVLWIVK